MTDKLIQKDCTTGVYRDIYPVTTLSAIKDLSTGKTLDIILEEFNHIYLPFKDNSKSLTRLQIPNRFRRKGLWITYNSCQGNVITEWYNSDDFSNKAWGDSKNWVTYLSDKLIKASVKELLSWYKA